MYNDRVLDVLPTLAVATASIITLACILTAGAR